MPLKILVVDDDPVSRSFLSMQLGFLKVAAQAAGGGKQALEKAQDTSFDMILLDCQMPEMDGFQTASALREAGYGGPIVGLSAEEGEVIRERCLQAGMNGHRAKPIDMAIAGELMRTYLPTPVADGATADAVSADPLARVRAMANKAGRPELARKMVESFVKANDGVVESLSQALQSDDTAAALSLLHRLKGSAGTLGAEEYGAETTRVEAQVAANGLEGCSAEVAQLVESWHKLRAHLLAGV